MLKNSRLRVHKASQSRRVLFSLVLLLLAFIAVWQVESRYGVADRLGDFWTGLQQRFTKTKSYRGTIFDRNLKQLATSVERVLVYVRTREVKSMEDILQKLGPVLSFNEQQIKDQFENGALRIWLADGIDDDQEKLVKKFDLPGVYLQKEEQRYYPNGTKAAHIIGYADAGIGVAGAELYYDKLLAAAKGEGEYQNELILTLDLKIQYIVDDLLSQIQTATQSRKCMAYLIENKTGELIAGAQIPGFNPNSFALVSPDVQKNSYFSLIPLPRAIKQFLSDAALLNTQSEVTGRAPEPWSINTTQEDLGSQLRLWEKIGLSETESKDLFGNPVDAGEKENPQFKPVETSSESFGMVPEQISPLALLLSMSALTSGYKTEPVLIRKKDQPHATISMPEVVAKPALPEIAHLLEGMSASESKKAVYLDGTVLTVTGGKWNSELVEIQLVYVLIPAAENNLSMLIVVEKPSAGPGKEQVEPLDQIIDSKVERISSLQLISRSIADVLEREKRANDNYEEPDSVLVQSPSRQLAPESPVVYGVMPDIVGLSLRRSLQMVQGMPLEVTIQGTGKVISQEPPPGTAIKKNMPCRIVLRQDSIQ